MKVCEEELVLARVGMPYTSRHQQNLKNIDDAVLAWAFLSFAAMLAALFLKQVLFIPDAAAGCFCCVWIFASRQRLCEDRADKRPEKERGRTKVHGHAEERGYAEERGCTKVRYLAAAVGMLAGLFAVAWQAEFGSVQMSGKTRAYALTTAIFGLLVKEVLFRYFAGKPRRESSCFAWSFRMGEWFCVFVLLACFLNPGEKSFAACLLTAAYMLLCAVVGVCGCIGRTAQDAVHSGSSCICKMCRSWLFRFMKNKRL